MRYIRNLYPIVIGILLTSNVKGQGDMNNGWGLNVGQTVPNVKIDNLINYKSKSATIEDFKGKLLIIDFWATWCGPCIGAFPKLDSLQKKFSDRIQILPVTTETEAVVTAFFSKMKAFKSIMPLTVTDDQRLRRYFRHTSLPHYVWIGPDQKVIAITEGTEVNAGNIQAVLEGKNISLPLKRDIQIISGTGTRDMVIPGAYVSNPSTGDPEFMRIPDSAIGFSSILVGYLEGHPSGGKFDSGMIVRYNATIYSLYETAFQGNGRELLNHLLTFVEVSDSALYTKITQSNMRTKKLVTNSESENRDWRRKNAYTYNLKVPSAAINERFKIMLNDLNNYFGVVYGIEGVLEVRNTKYLSLQRINSQEDKLKTNGGNKISSANQFSLVLQNASLDDLLWNLAKPLQKEPFIIDETGYKGKIDLEINCNLSDLDAVNKELNRYGLKLVSQEKPMQVGVIRKKSN